LVVTQGKEEDLISASLFAFGGGESFPLLGPQAVHERVDEGWAVVAGWEDVWRDTRVLGGKFGGPVNSFIASNAAVSRSPNEGHMVVGGFRLSCMRIRLTRGSEELTSWIARRAASDLIEKSFL